MLRSLAFVALLATSRASPVERKDLSGLINSVECKAVNLVVTALNQYSSATPFCSSFLGIQTKTLTATATTSTFTTTTTISQAPTSIITASAVTVTQQEVDSITTCIPQAYKRDQEEKRATVSIKTPSLPSCVASFQSAQISIACSCLAIPTPSTTKTITHTSTPVITSVTTTTPLTTYTPTVTITTTLTSTNNVCPTPTSCNNQGVQFGYYNQNIPQNSDSHYSSFSPESYKTQTPAYSSVTSTLGGINDYTTSTITIYGSTQTFPLSYFVLNHRGYLFAEVSGTYTFTLSEPDDITLLWVGPTAYSGWTRENANVYNYVGSGTSQTYQLDLVQGQYYPLRIVFGQAQGGAVFSASIQAPDGTVILDSSSGPSPYLVQYSCDGVLAPQYAAFGAES